MHYWTKRSLKDRASLDQEDNAAMKTLSTILFAITLSLGLTVVVMAQTPTPTPGKRTPVATKRQGNQQKRIGEGVASGELKKGEVRKLEKEQRDVQQALEGSPGERARECVRVSSVRAA